MAEHHLQRQIIERLAFAPGLTFSELKPDELANNAFSYHLKQVLADKLVEKDGDHYRLTPEGQRYVDKYSLEMRRARPQPKVICQIALRNEKGAYLLAQHKRQPFLGKWALLSGKQHFGESAEAHVTRELEEQLGGQPPLKHAGFMDFRISRDELVSHVVGPVYTGIFEGEVPAENAKFAYALHDAPRTLALVPGTAEILAAIDKDESDFFLSLDLCEK